MKQHEYRTRFLLESGLEVAQRDRVDAKQQVVADEGIEDLKRIVERNQADLSVTEQTVIRRRFNWKEFDESSMTLEEVGKIIGVSKERVRQIQNKALAKIRNRMETGVLRDQVLEAKSEYKRIHERKNSPSSMLAL